MVYAILIHFLSYHFLILFIGSELSFNQETYHVGDVVYIEATERNMDNHVYLIERLWTAADGQQMFFGNWFCRPNETFHLASRKFLEQVCLYLHFLVEEWRVNN